MESLTCSLERKGLAAPSPDESLRTPDHTQIPRRFVGPFCCRALQFLAEKWPVPPLSGCLLCVLLLKIPFFFHPPSLPHLCNRRHLWPTSVLVSSCLGGHFPRYSPFNLWRFPARMLSCSRETIMLPKVRFKEVAMQRVNGRPRRTLRPRFPCPPEVSPRNPRRKPKPPPSLCAPPGDDRELAAGFLVTEGHRPQIIRPRRHPARPALPPTRAFRHRVRPSSTPSKATSSPSVWPDPIKVRFKQTHLCATFFTSSKLRRFTQQGFN